MLLMNSQLQVNFRKQTFDTLELIASKPKQLDYQNRVPIAQVSAELFCWWQECYQDVKDRDWYQGAFTQTEFTTLKNFDLVFEQVCAETEQKVPYITDFVHTKQWRKLTKAAKLALSDLAAT
jgi:hypothetical protein